MGRLVIERGQESDGETLLAIYEGVLGEGRWFVSAPEEFLHTPETYGRHIAWMNGQDNSVYLVGRVQRAVVGAVYISGGTLRRLRHTGRLEIFLDPRFRGGGVGRAMMMAAVAWAEENPRLKKLSLNVYDDNARAIALYRSLGFMDEGHRKGEYREQDGTLRGDLLMSRPV